MFRSSCEVARDKKSLLEKSAELEGNVVSFRRVVFWRRLFNAVSSALSRLVLSLMWSGISSFLMGYVCFEFVTDGSEVQGKVGTRPMAF